MTDQERGFINLLIGGAVLFVAASVLVHVVKWLLFL